MSQNASFSASISTKDALEHKTNLIGTCDLLPLSRLLVLLAYATLTVLLLLTWILIIHLERETTNLHRALLVEFGAQLCRINTQNTSSGIAEPVLEHIKHVL